MKLCIVFTFVGALQISATSYSQGKKISIDMKNASLRSVLDEIEKVSQYTFFYNENFVDLNKTVSVDISNSDISGVLNAIFDGTELTYHQLENKMIVVAPSKFQEKVTITGKITDQKGEPLIGASVVEKGTNNGTTSDGKGDYTLKVSSNKAIVVFSYIGFLNEEIAVEGQSIINVQLAESSTQLNEVVVTALGIQRKARGLTYSTQQISGDELGAKELNVINSLGGKSAGIVIGRSSSGVGGSLRVILRGNKSINNQNQPLYVIDGIPINNSDLGQIGGSQLAGTVDGGDAISNINPDDIESITVLKGASASALYGSLGENGVILITTKKGIVGKTRVEFSSTTSFESPLILPKLQGSYGAAAPPTSKTDNDPLTWGNKDNGAITTSDLRKFFKTGGTYVNSISLSSGNSENQYYMSYANTVANGIVESNSLDKNNLYVKGNSKLFKNLSVEASGNLITQDVKDRPFVGFQSNPVGEAFLYPGSSSAFGALKNNYQVFNEARGIDVQNYPYSSYNSTSYLLDNPYWTIHKNPNELKRNREIFTANAKWDITKSLNLRGRVSYDRIDDQFEQDVYATSSSIAFDANGAYTLHKSTTSQTYSDLLLSFNKEDLNNFSVNAAIGLSNNYSYGYNQDVMSVLGQNNFIATNVFSLTNLTGSFTHTENTTETLTQSVFGTATLGWKNMLYLDVTGRNEWASTISNENFFYPSVGGTFILSELTGVNNIINFAKLRAAYSEVGNALPYGINNGPDTQYWTVTNGKLQNLENGVPILADGTPVTLKPERSKSIEIGGNVHLFNNTTDLDVTYYNNNVENQFFPAKALLGAYVPYFYANAGQIRNRGVEVMLSYKLLSAKGLKYITSLNFAYNDNKIISVNDQTNTNTFILTEFARTKIAEVRMVKGGEFGDLYSTTFKRDAGGKVVTDSTGVPQIANGDYVRVGNPNSPTQLGWSNTISYKGLTFKFLIDGKFGGKVISLTESDLDANGRSKRTADARDAGKVEFEGQTYTNVQNWYKGLAGIGSNYVYNATTVRVREISLGYDLPAAFSHGVIKNWNLSVYGRNLLFLYNKAPFDPEVSATSTTKLQGIDALSMPATRSFGFSLKAAF